MLAAVGIERRLHQLVPPRRAALWLPLDDSLISGPEACLRRPDALLGPDVLDHVTAVLGFRGTLTACRKELGGKPFILNLSASTVRGEHTNKVPIGRVIDALRAGVQAVAYHVNHTSPFEADALRELARVVGEADDLGLPVVAFAYPRGRRPDGTDENHLALRDGDVEEFARLVRHGVRLAVELGASAIKTIYTGTVDSFETVVSAALGVPIVIAGERLVDVGAAVEKAQAAIRAGARGVAYGRQIFERDEPASFVQKLRSALDDAWQERPMSASAVV